MYTCFPSTVTSTFQKWTLTILVLIDIALKSVVMIDNEIFPIVKVYMDIVSENSSFGKWYSGKCGSGKCGFNIDYNNLDPDNNGYAKSSWI